LEAPRIQKQICKRYKTAQAILNIATEIVNDSLAKRQQRFMPSLWRGAVLGEFRSVPAKYRAAKIEDPEHADDAWLDFEHLVLPKRMWWTYGGSKMGKRDRTQNEIHLVHIFQEQIALINEHFQLEGKDRLKIDYQRMCDFRYWLDHFGEVDTVVTLLLNKHFVNDDELHYITKTEYMEEHRFSSSMHRFVMRIQAAMTLIRVRCPIILEREVTRLGGVYRYKPRLELVKVNDPNFGELIQDTRKHLLDANLRRAERIDLVLNTIRSNPIYSLLCDDTVAQVLAYYIDETDQF
jgi:hypothetical protein